MKNALTLTALLAIVTLCSVPVTGETLEPLTVSPGAVDRVSGVEVRCPTFSWQAVPGAVAYEVVVYELPPETNLAAWSLDDGVEVLFVELPAGVTAWTPSLERGLARGTDHVWFVRGVFGDFGLDEVDAIEWSVARFFRVAGGVVDSETEVRSRGGSVTSGTGTGAGRARVAADRNVMAKRVGEKNTKDVGTAMAAIRGEMPDATGETYGVVGTSNSLEGAGLAGVNTTEGPDLVLDGQANGRTDAYLFDWGLDRSSPDVEVFGFTNEEGGTLDVYVQGEMHARTLVGDGADVMDVDAVSLDGMDASFYLDASNLDAGTLSVNRYSAILDLGAEGYLANTAGGLSQNNGVKQQTLHADLLDGYQAGNLGDEIPISNGALNVDLNADQLDGLHASDLALATETYTKAEVDFLLQEAAPNSYYLTAAYVDGLNALSACDSGYHMASFFELFDMSNLKYASDHPAALSHVDSGMGPPSGVAGWVRTGFIAIGADNIPGASNCDTWTSNRDDYYGSNVAIVWDWAVANTKSYPWYASATTCDHLMRVWCVQDH